MIRQKRKIQLKTGAILLLYLLICILCLFGVPSAQSVNAGEAGSNNVLKELQNDESFNVEDYPEDPDDYSLQLIQIAETKSGGLALYVYQPSSKYWNFKAEEIRMSITADEDNAKYLDYSLSFVASSEQFYKYTVKGFKVNSDPKRYYSIVQITRPFYPAVDGEQKLENGNYINNVVYPINQTWVAETAGNSVSYSVIVLDTIKVTDKYIGILSYSTKDGLVSGSISYIFYVAFSTDLRIENLLEATVKYDVVGIDQVTGKEYVTYLKDQISTVTADDVISLTSGSWWSGYDNHKFSAIQSSSDFIKSMDEDSTNLKPSVLKDIASKAWVVQFHNSVWHYGWTSSGGISKPSPLTDAPSQTSILQLTYETEGVSYNMGVIDDKRTSNGRVDNYSDDWPWWYYVIIVVVIILLIILLPLLLPILLPIVITILKILFKSIWWLIKHLGIALWWIISLPFRAIAALIRKIKGDGGG